MKPIRLHEPNISGNEFSYVNECLKDNWVSTSGKYVELFEKKISKYTNSKFSIAVLNGTIALQTSLILSEVLASDEVIVPTITFVATINAIKHTGANPIFMDIDDYLNLDQEKSIEFIKKKTFFKNGYTYNKISRKRIKAIIIVHVFGNAARFEELYNLCEKRNIDVIEDAAESIGTRYTKGKFKNKHTGTIGKLGFISFNGNKTITAGNGGVILTNNKKIAEKARYLITQAKDDPINFIHNNVGYNFKLSNVCAAIGVAQIENLNYFLKKKKKIHEIYKKKINQIDGLEILNCPDYAINNHWLNILKISNKKFNRSVKNLIRDFDKGGIQTRPIWFPNHMQKPFKKYMKYKINKAERIIRNLICLPSSSQLEVKSINKIVNILR